MRSLVVGIFHHKDQKATRPGALDIMHKDDQYREEALRAARSFAAKDPCLKLDADAEFLQGKNNQVLGGAYDGEAVVIKYYGDGYKSRTPARIRKQRELAFLRNAKCVRTVPTVLAEDDQLAVLQRIEGEPLAAMMGKQGIRSAPPGIASQIGTVHRLLFDLHLESGSVLEIESSCFESESLGERLDNLLAAAEGYAEHDQFRDIAIETLQTIKAAMPEILSGPRVLYRYDNNLGNVLTDSNWELCSLIDFEQCFIGTPILYLGAVFDCAHAIPWGDHTGFEVFQQLPWNALASGLALANLSESMRLVTIAAMLNHWMRVSDILERQPDAQRWIPRFKSRFQVYLRMLSELD
jgi:hypothetical protein